jgi:hypothetical protein
LRFQSSYNGNGNGNGTAFRRSGAAATARNPKREERIELAPPSATPQIALSALLQRQ